MFDMTEGNPETLGVILAGGLSSRMKRDKAKLVLPNGLSLLAHAQKLMASVSVAEVVISGLQGVPDLYPERGPLGGIFAVTQHYPEMRLLVIPVDMPLLKPKVLNALLDENNPNNLPVVFSGQPLPLLLPVTEHVVSYLNGVVEGKNAASIKSMLAELNCIQLPKLDEYYFFNCNTPEEFDSVCQHLR
ncbi:molybdenum cofactor guanylyltransferase [Zooshikella marina]|uniref:molybdenum cofactor guanylyltransferase n=1 Tax=Zooshikella ganghwensis TaxID=202772 RepID=UPI001BAFAAAD|nr:molybdenum cofactor guanylyltransferase [Zooshikella ganghwensis]MBU2706309.1 molybdenum cofactor guanylyltransferase [Zooshikella ganghwensis]